MLSNPYRFDREAYLYAKNAQKSPNPNDFWKEIESETFIVNGSDICTINDREVLPTDAAFITEIEKAF